jgi:hypothetical protein
MKKQIYNSLEELRVDKHRLSRRLEKMSKALGNDAVDCVLPSSNAFLSSDFPYMRYIGYGITAFKTFNFVRKIVGFVSTRRWR